MGRAEEEGNILMRKPIEGARVLVTGGAGFIGSHLADALLDQGAARVAIVDNLFLGKEENAAEAVSRGASFFVEDAEDADKLERIIRSEDIEVVFNLATKALNYSFINPRDAFDTNVKVIGNLLEMQRNGLFETLCHFSSSEVYGTALYTPMDEAHPRNPTTTYAGGKAAADLMLKTYESMFGVDAFIVRPFNNYGPRQNWEGPLAGIIPITARRIIEGGTPEIHGTGEQSRDFIYVRDTVKAVLALYEIAGKGADVNIAADGNISMNDLVEKICRIMGYRGEVARKARRGADVDCHMADNSLVKSLIDFETTSIDEGLSETLAWYENRLGNQEA